MSDPIDHPERLFRVELDGDTSVYAEKEQSATPGDLVPMVTIRMPAVRAHSLAHLMLDWTSAFRMAPDRRDKPNASLLGRSLEDAAAALGDPDALVCATRARGSVSAGQRMAAVGVLRVSEPAMSAVERIAVVDSAARWLDEDAGSELAYALLRAACSSEVNASQAYVELISPTPDVVPADDTSGRRTRG